jgi:cell division septum initiation protein DivIVA
MVGGYDAAATEEFLRAVAGNYAWLLKEWETLTRKVQDLEREAAEHAEQLSSARSELEQRQHPDELARLVLQASQRAARDVREAARAESEAAIKKARGRAAEIESEIERTKASIVSEIAALDAERERLRETLRTTLTGVLDAVERPLNGASPSGDEAAGAPDGLVQALQARTTQSDQ